MKTTGDKIKGLRLSLGETMEEFGKRFGCSKGVISNWENGYNFPNTNRLKQISDLSGISLSELKPNNIGELITDYLIDNKMTLETFGNKFQPPVSKSNVSKWTKGLNLPSQVRLKELSTILNVDIETLLGNNGLSRYTDAELIKELISRGYEIQSSNQN